MKGKLVNDLLPDTLSELIMVVVKDGKSLDRTLYLPGVWTHYHKLHNGTCYVCDAGAVIAGTLQFSREDGEYYNLDINYKLNALDRARAGYYCRALELLGIPVPEQEFPDHLVSPYKGYTTWEEFDKHLEHMEWVAKELKERGY